LWKRWGPVLLMRVPVPRLSLAIGIAAAASPWLMIVLSRDETGVGPGQRRHSPWLVFS